MSLSEEFYLSMNIAELKAELDKLQRAWDQSMEIIRNQALQNNNLIAENALLRKALRDAPHDRHCNGMSNLMAGDGPPGPCDCWKSRIPDAKP